MPDNQGRHEEEQRGRLPMDGPPVLTPAALSAQLGVDEDTLQLLRESGAGPAYITLGPRTIRYLASDVSAWHSTPIRHHEGHEIVSPNNGTGTPFPEPRGRGEQSHE